MFFASKKGRINYNLSLVRAYRDMKDQCRPDYVFRKCWSKTSWFGLKKTIYAEGYYRRWWFSDDEPIKVSKEEATYKEAVRVWFIGKEDYMDFVFDTREESLNFITNILTSKQQVSCDKI